MLLVLPSWRGRAERYLGTLGPRQITCAGFWDDLGSVWGINTARDSGTETSSSNFLPCFSKIYGDGKYESTASFSKITSSSTDDCPPRSKTVIKRYHGCDSAEHTFALTKSGQIPFHGVGESEQSHKHQNRCQSISWSSALPSRF